MYTSKTRNTIIEELRRKNTDKVYSINNIELFLSRKILVPNPDTFKLIDIASKIIRSNMKISTIADVGTGSGIIGISLAKMFPNKTLYASDICEHSINIAKKNAKHNKLSNITFILNKDEKWLSEYNNIKIDTVVSNPPFVGNKEFNSLEFRREYPESSIEPKKAIRTYCEKGIQPFLSILEASNSIYEYIFQCNKSFVTHVEEIINKKHGDRYETEQYRSRFLRIRKKQSIN